MRPVIYIFLNKSLGMSAGKLAAQAAHAAAMSVINSPSEMVSKWEDSVHKTMIVLQAKDDNHLKNIYEYLEQRGFHMIKIIDEGANEVEPHSWTALSSQILNKEQENVELAFSTFRLYRDTVRLTLEVDK